MTYTVSSGTLNPTQLNSFVCAYSTGFLCLLENPGNLKLKLLEFAGTWTQKYSCPHT